MVIDKEKLKYLVSLQFRFNEETNGEEWLTGVTKEGKEINWYTCMVDEGVEVLGSYPWKHWKDLDKEPDLENVKLEIVDILHFLISAVGNVYHVEEGEHNEVDMVTDVMYNILTNETPVIGNTSYTEGIMEFIHSCTNANLYYLRTKDETYIGTGTYRDNINDIMKSFKIMNYVTVNMSFDDMYKLYIGKNALNKVRQMNGYKTGEYKKTWNGVEDNVTMMEELDKVDESLLTLEKFTGYLDEYYKTKVNGAIPMVCNH